MKDVMITSKRQATLPAALCRELGVGPGDRVRVERRLVDGEKVWILRGRQLDWSWHGAARRHARGKSHAWSKIQRSIERGVMRERRT
jgi:bifunctional DNA-binding transcriptional regulator/antitoxin component of YhaV-PrlF toxin-antitoxin module